MTYQAARENVLKYQNEMMYFNRRLCDMHGFWMREGLSDSLESLIKKHDAARAKWVEAKELLAVTQ